MAQFIGKVQGNKGECHRLGSKNSGLETVCNGWVGGIKVLADCDEDGNDTFHVYATSGSNAKQSDTFLGTLSTSVAGDGVWLSAIKDKKTI